MFMPVKKNTKSAASSDDYRPFTRLKAPIEEAGGTFPFDGPDLIECDA
jgi:hypothetical protein